MLQMAKKLWSEEEGQGMAEYGLILALVAVVAAVTLKTLGGTITDTFTETDNKLTGTTTT